MLKIKTLVLLTFQVFKTVVEIVLVKNKEKDFLVIFDSNRQDKVVDKLINPSFLYLQLKPTLKGRLSEL